MKLSINPATSVVEEPQLHDSTLIQCSFEAKTACLRFKTISKEIVELTLHGVRGLSINSIFEANIVFEVIVIPIENADIRDILRVFHMDNAKSAADERLKLEKSFVMLRIDPTLGLDALAACREITWAKV